MMAEWRGMSDVTTVDSGFSPGQFKSKAMKIDIHSFPAWRSAIKRQCEAFTVCDGEVAAWMEDLKGSFVVSGQDTLAIKM